MSIDVSMFRQVFFEEATELLNTFEDQLLSLENNRHDKEVLNTIFRCAHSIKGGSSTFGLPSISQFTHGVETLLDKVRSGSVAVTPELCGVLFRSLDQIRALVRSAMGEGEVAPDDAALVAEIERLSGDGSAVSELIEEPATIYQELRYRLSLKPGLDVMRTGSDPTRMLEHLLEFCSIESIARDDSLIPPLDQLDPEACYIAWEMVLNL